ncbi:MAG TPA: DPP IV N-terminal domain-containing protein, partial [Terriglobales bacterium]|nr:DPP IV N-terminal domain-containing protein [Terriglobales bacterium]
MPSPSLPRRGTVLTLLALVACAAAQSAPKVVTAADYAHAEKFLGYNTAPLVLGGRVQPGWLPDGRFWYETTTASGNQYVLVNPARATREPALDSVKVAAALSAAAGAPVATRTLALQNLSFSSDGRSVSFTADRRRWQCDRQGSSCAPDTRPAPPQLGGRGRGGFGRGGRGGPPPQSVAPNGKVAVFIRNWNLWLRDLTTHQETQLTTDGVENFGYATDNAGWTSSKRPIVLWSPDSRKIATYQQDQRGVGKLYLVPVVVGHPKLVTQIYPLPGDKVITTIQRVIIDLPTASSPAKVIRLQMPPDQHRSTIADNLAWGPDQDVQWSPDGAQLGFVSTSRDHKDEHVRVADPSTGAVRTVYEEKVATQYEGGQGGSTFRFLPASHEFLWYSQRDNLGQLYLYDLDTGKLKNQITTLADGNVDSVVRVDAQAREVYFIATAVPGRDPYYLTLYRASFDGRHQQRLTPEAANHNVTFSPNGQYFTDTYSTPDTPPISVLRSASGRLVMPLEKADISRLLATGWKPPVEVQVKARDGVTDIYGLMFTPFQLEPGRKYP